MIILFFNFEAFTSFGVHVNAGLRILVSTCHRRRRCWQASRRRAERRQRTIALALAPLKHAHDLR